MRGRRQAVEIVFDHATKRYPGRAAPAVDDLTFSIPAGEVCCLVGPSGRRQDDRDEARQPARRAHLGRREDRRAERQLARRDRAAPRHRLRDPAGRPLPAHDRRRERGHRAEAARLVEVRDRRARGRAARPRRPAGEGLPLPLRVADLGRRAPARRPRARARGRPAGDADGRAVRRPRSDHPHAAAEGAAADPGRGAEDDHLRHARHRRGDPASAPGSRSCARAASSSSTTRPTRSSLTRPTTSSRASSGGTGASSVCR